MNGRDELKRTWIDQYVVIQSAAPELARFAEKVGRVVTINENGKCLVDFQDGGWYDICPEALAHCLNQEIASAAFNSTNSTMPRIPVRQS